MPARPHLAVKLANQASPEALLAKLKDSYGAPTARAKHVDVPWHSASARLEIYSTKTLPSASRDWIWSLFECNMRCLYEAQQDGYDAQEKRAEVFHPDSRFLVLSPSSPAPAAGAAPPRSAPLGFCIFRFDTEETASEDDDELCDVAYCYELQVEGEQHGKGVGRVLMDALERTARAWRMDKVMLTVFKANEQALAFYDKVGYTEDEIDPGRFGVVDVDYSILSKSLSP
ncbi:hypothetical protein JCM8208_006863 [Rhodotorula glutinis]